jgi:GrpB-like predicted nucleotidyltransferase (UPF0157 family)
MLESFALPIPNPLVIVPYDVSWPQRAADEAVRLSEALGTNLIKVEHIGSTSVPGLAAKPIIDLMPLVGDLAQLERDRALFESLGYRWHGEYGIEGRRFCTLSNAAGERLVNVHCFQADSPQIERHLAFRDYLRSHPGVALEYEKEKRRAAELHPRDVNAYNDEKCQWVLRTEAEALAWLRAKR